MRDENYQLLGNAVVEQAAKDYRKALCKLHSKRLSKQKRIEYGRLLADAKSFFLGEDFQLFTKLDGPSLMRAIDSECEKFNYNLKKIMESRKEKET